MYLMELFRRYKFKSMLNRYKNILEVSEKAIILNSFNIDVRVHSVKKRIKIGNDSMVGCSFVFESPQGYVFIGERTYVGGATLIAHSDIIIGDDVTIAWGVCLYTHDSHSLDWKERVKDIARQNEDYRAGRSFIASKDWSVVKTAPIRICNKAWIGMNAIILKGVTIGEGAIVGAGSVVTNDVPAWSVVAGNPACVVKMLK